MQQMILIENNYYKKNETLEKSMQKIRKKISTYVTDTKLAPPTLSLIYSISTMLVRNNLMKKSNKIITISVKKFQNSRCNLFLFYK